MEDSRCSSAVADFERGKDKMKWIAVTNPTGTTIHCSGTLIDSNGNTLGGNTVSISSFGQASFTLGNAISQANSSPSSYNLDCQGAPFEALAIAGNSRGITSSLPPGDYALPSDRYPMIWNAFYQLVKALNNVPGLEVGHPNLQILSDQVINAQFDRTTNSVKIQLALVELLADSPSEIAWVIGHELGHAHQRLSGATTFDPNIEHDADYFSLLGLLLTGYDAYAAGGALGKLMMASERTGLLNQLFDDIADPHSSFPTRMGLILTEVQTICGLSQAASLCTTEHTSFHPHMTTTSTPLLKEAPPDAFGKIQPSP